MVRLGKNEGFASRQLTNLTVVSWLVKPLVSFVHSSILISRLCQKGTDLNVDQLIVKHILHRAATEACIRLLHVMFQAYYSQLECWSWVQF